MSSELKSIATPDVVGVLMAHAFTNDGWLRSTAIGSRVRGGTVQTAYAGIGYEAPLAMAIGWLLVATFSELKSIAACALASELKSIAICVDSRSWTPRPP